MAKTSVLFDVYSKSIILTPNEVRLWGARPEVRQFVEALSERFADEMRAYTDTLEEAETRALRRIIVAVAALLAHSSETERVALVSPPAAERDFPLVKAAFEARCWDVSAYEDSEIGGWIWRFERSRTR